MITINLLNVDSFRDAWMINDPDIQNMYTLGRPLTAHMVGMFMYAYFDVIVRHKDVTRSLYRVEISNADAMALKLKGWEF